MAQPTIQELFGADATYDVGLDALVLPRNIFANEGVIPDSGLPIELLAVIIKIAHTALATNTDETVNLAITLNTSSPASRNGVDKTSFNYGLEFFGEYTAPVFNPSDL